MRRLLAAAATALFLSGAAAPSKAWSQTGAGVGGGWCRTEALGSFAEKQHLAMNSLLDTRDVSSALAALRAEWWSDTSWRREIETTLLDPESGDETAIALYAEDAARDELCVFFISSNGRVDTALARLSASKIFAKIDALREKSGVARAQMARAPRPKGQRQAAVGRVKIKGIRSKELTALSEALFPGGLASRVAQYGQVVIVPIRNIGTAPFPALRPTADRAEFVDTTSFVIAPSLVDVVLAFGQGPRTAQARRFAGGNFDSCFLKRVRASGDVPEGSFDQECRRDPRREDPVAHNWPAYASALIVGNPDFAQVSSAWRDRDGKSWSFPQLPGAQSEAETVAQTLEFTAVTGTSATRESIVNASQGKELLYYATHGIADAGRDPGDLGMLVLGDGVWTGREIQQESLSASLAVLSACQTGLGPNRQGGVMGLARAFYIASTPQVVMSLWSVNDLATADLMKDFAGHIAMGERTGEALRLAMVSTRRKHPDPAYWASFVTFGLPDAACCRTY